MVASECPTGDCLPSLPTSTNCNRYTEPDDDIPQHRSKAILDIGEASAENGLFAYRTEAKIHQVVLDEIEAWLNLHFRNGGPPMPFYKYPTVRHSHFRYILTFANDPSTA